MSTAQRMTDEKMSAIVARAIELPNRERELAIFGAIGGLRGLAGLNEILKKPEPTASGFFRLLDEEVTKAEKNVKKEDK